MVWSLGRCRSTCSLGLARLTWPMEKEAVIMRKQATSSRWRCLLILFTYSPECAVQIFWAGRHDARKLLAQWSEHSCLLQNPMRRLVAASQLACAVEPEPHPPYRRRKRAAALRVLCAVLQGARRDMASTACGFPLNPAR